MAHSTDDIWHYKTVSTLAHVMACCLMAPSHYLNRCGLISKLNLLLPGQNCRMAIFKCIFVNEKFHIWIQISLKYVPDGQIENKSALVQVMARRRRGAKSLPISMLTHFTNTCTCSTRGKKRAKGKQRHSPQGDTSAISYWVKLTWKLQVFFSNLPGATESWQGHQWQFPTIGAVCLVICGQIQD